MYLHENSLLLAMLGSPSVNALPQTKQQAPSYPIQWSSCNETETGVSLRNYTLLQCGTMQVPMDWSDPLGQKITLDIARLQTNGTSRNGTLFVNPGGPGGAAHDYCYNQALGEGRFSGILMEHFDLICPDPRGVGPSSMVQCDINLWQSMPSEFIDDEASFQQVLEYNKKLGESCLNMTGPLLGFVDTTSVARDLDAVRIGLGESKMNWLGFSYGTQLGAAYAELFPQNIRAMALDGIVNHAESAIDALVLDNWGDDREYEVTRLLAWCNANSSCAFYNETDDAALAWDAMIANANKNPIPAPGCLATSKSSYAGTCKPKITGHEIFSGLENYLGRPNLWPWYSQLIKEAIDGNATLLSSSISSSSVSFDLANLAVGCLDWQMNVSTFEQYTTLQSLVQAMAPTSLGSSMLFGFAARCVGWPFNVTNPQHWLNSTQMAKAPWILLVQSTNDHSTPLPWAYGLAAQIPRAALVTRVGDDHLSYKRNPEVRAIVDAYLVNLTVPEPNTVVDPGIDSGRWPLRS
ncbi:Alpha/Beta hydrolase protein [Exophiala viscosa]|uniref:Alpha/Beta hydrolase protein n=1 Tax=Exophiala viscosa TaxID=2486360 RepID=A0AAN6DNA6_9EURO|nr:Alpha/Beta hydrolase protein [Exophiala viscosa]